MKLKLVLWILILPFILWQCSNSKDVNPITYLDTVQQRQLKMELSRYMDKLPSQTTMEQRWDSSRFVYYNRKANQMHLLALYKKDSSYYFVCSRIVPSIHPGDRRAHIGKLQWDGNRIYSIEEYYWSNILPEATINENAPVWLNEVIESSTNEVSKNSKKMMEWPNDYFYYDKVNKSWSRRP
ncbi:MAG: hypothetical protein MUE33_07785 [Cytophagaceae bacterium]|jgi:hypothetical protein|nr:hypothetical protein [Cytophagaceae bacterium]